ncbi:hypothetical protein CHELA41_23368 [Hyphomicrobiales bacterium]|nr:hypothetical protein CHELA41_23368 [Hyphomicrobiales bacterium]
MATHEPLLGCPRRGVDDPDLLVDGAVILNPEYASTRNAGRWSDRPRAVTVRRTDRSAGRRPPTTVILLPAAFRNRRPEYSGGAGDRGPRGYS